MLYAHYIAEHNTSMTEMKNSPDAEIRALYVLSKETVKISEHFNGAFTFADLHWQSFTMGKLHKDDELHQVISVLDTEPRGCRQVRDVTDFYVLWDRRQHDGSLWVSIEPKNSFLPSGVHSVSYYYARFGISYQNAWLVLTKPDDSGELSELSRTTVDHLVSTVAASRTEANTVANYKVTELLHGYNLYCADSDKISVDSDGILTDTASEGDVLSSEGEIDTDDLEDDIDTRPDTTYCEMLAELKELLFAIHKLKKSLGAKRINWTEEMHRNHSAFDDKFRCLSKNPFKYFRNLHTDDFVFD